jgi:hypothetical protein
MTKRGGRRCYVGNRLFLPLPGALRDKNPRKTVTAAACALVDCYCGASSYAIRCP